PHYPKRDFDLSVQAAGYIPFSAHVAARPAEEKMRTIELEPLTQKDQSFTLHNIYFDYDSANIKTASQPVLTRLASFLQLNPHLRIKIVGHTDRHGSSRYNQLLSQKRAQSVLEALVRLGISVDRLSSSGAGYQQPLSTDASKEADRMNRRTEFQIIN
ncbi:MAG: OmpA family protein, partial [Leptospiraceae bacterium]|nr:OmpA family protein [Leptospiraceae bacterium]